MSLSGLGKGRHDGGARSDWCGSHIDSKAAQKVAIVYASFTDRLPALCGVLLVFRQGGLARDAVFVAQGGDANVGGATGHSDFKHQSEHGASVAMDCRKEATEWA